MKQRAFDVLGNIAIVSFHDFEKVQTRRFNKTPSAPHPPIPSRIADKIKSARKFVSIKKISLREKKKFAERILRNNKNLKTILEKVGKVKGRLRKVSTRYLAGEKTKEVLYKENGCVFRFDVDETYFSPRLSNERKEIAAKIKKGENVLVMFAGVGPFSIVIAKNSKAGKVFSNEINRKANKYAKLNVELNKLKKKVVLVPGDVKRIVKKIGVGMLPTASPTTNSQAHSKSRAKEFREHCSPLNLRSPKARVINKSLLSSKLQQTSDFSLSTPKFDVIVMPRPQLRETFLREAFKVSKKGTRIFYYDFCKEDEKKLVVEKIQKQAKQFRRKVKILKVKKAGEIAPYKIRVRVDFIVQ